MALQPSTTDAIIRVRDITVQFGKTRVLDGLNLDVKRGEILGFVGPSGAGKSVLTRTIIGLVPKVAGRIEVFGVDLDAADAAQRRGVERRWGILFQQGALFSSLTVRQNIQFPVREYLNLSQQLLDEVMVAKLVIGSLLLVIVSFFLLAEFSGAPPDSVYVPAHMDHGKLVPGLQLAQCPRRVGKTLLGRAHAQLVEGAQNGAHAGR